MLDINRLEEGINNTAMSLRRVVVTWGDTEVFPKTNNGQR